MRLYRGSRRPDNNGKDLAFRMLLGEKGSGLRRCGIALLMFIDLRRCQAAQHGQVLKLRSRRSDGKARWAYRYRLNGSHCKRPQVGGFDAREEDAERALKRELARFRPGREVMLKE